MTRWTERRQVRYRYFTAQRAAGDAWAALTAVSHPGGRMIALYRLAEQARVMAETAHAFRRADARDEDGFTLTDSHEREAWLAGLIADTEAALVFWHEVDTTPPAAPRPNPEAAVVLAQLRAEPRLIARGVLVLALYDAMATQAGTRAAEVLPAIACAYFQGAGMSYQDAARRAWARGGSR